MNTLHECYRELIALSQLYLLQNFSPTDRLECSLPSYNEYREYAKKLRSKTITLPAAEDVAKIVPTAPNLVTREIAFKKEPDSPKTPPLEQDSPHVSSTFAKVANRNEEQKKTLNTYNKASLDLLLQPFSSSKVDDFKDIKQFFSKQLPEVHLIEQVPSDEKAKIIKERWKEKTKKASIIIAIATEDEKERTFLLDIGRAIRFHIPGVIALTAGQLESEWNHLLTTSSLKFLISSPKLFESLPDWRDRLKKKEKNQFFLDHLRILLIQDLPQYFKEPQHKLKLWQTLRELIHENR